MNTSTKSTKKVCVLTDAWRPVWGGGQEHIWQIYSRLAKKGFTIDLIVPQLLPNSKIENIPNLNIVKIGPAFVFPNIFGRLGFMMATILYVLTNNYDLYHSHSPSTSICLVPLKLVGKKIACTIHGKGQKGLGAGVINKLTPLISLLGGFFTYIMPYDLLFTAAQSTIERKVNAKKLVVTGNGVNIKEYDLIKAKKSETWQILWVGRFDPVKGLNYLVEAVTKVAKCKLVLVGDGPEKENIKKLVKDSKLDGKVLFTGFLSGKEKVKVFKQSSVFVLPSLSEGFPLVLIEAMAAKLPVVATKVGDIPKLVKSSKGGYLVKAESGLEIGKALKDLKSNSRKTTQLGINGYNYVKANYSWEQVTAKVEKAYTLLFA